MPFEPMLWYLKIKLQVSHLCLRTHFICKTKKNSDTCKNWTQYCMSLSLWAKHADQIVVLFQNQYEFATMLFFLDILVCKLPFANTQYKMKFHSQDTVSKSRCKFHTCFYAIQWKTVIRTKHKVACRHYRFWAKHADLIVVLFQKQYEFVGIFF